MKNLVSDESSDSRHRFDGIGKCDGYEDFIRDEEIRSFIYPSGGLTGGVNGSEKGIQSRDFVRVREILAKALSKEALRPQETAILLGVEDPSLREEIFESARQLKERVYGNRIVLFAPFYVGNYCTNDCQYCGFRRSNKEIQRRTLNPEEIRSQVQTLIKQGHKRLILVFGEHGFYSPEFIHDVVRIVSQVRDPHEKDLGEIRRVNVNAAPLDRAGFAKVKSAGIGTYQIFQETYDHDVYSKWHPPKTKKGDYLWRLHGPTRAMEAGCDDVGIGALFGLGDWRFEVTALVQHANYLMDRFHCGPHTVSFPRIRPASGFNPNGLNLQSVSDDDMKMIVAILRLSIPYTGLILTAREPAQLRRELMGFGVSQIDAGSCIEMGGYSDSPPPTPESKDLNSEDVSSAQFKLGDNRSLDQVICELLEDQYIPSFCTSCYVKGRTGEHFMEFAIPGFIKNLCTPNALLTLTEYLEDYGSEKTKTAGFRAVEKELERLPDSSRKEELKKELQRIRSSRTRNQLF